MPPPPDLLVLAAGAFGAPGCDAVVVRDGRIAAVTTRREALAARGPRTRVIDAPRGLLCSGFQDAHAHLVPLARARREIDLHGCGLATIRDAVRAAGARTPAGRWLVGRGFDPEAFRVAGIAPRALLDEAAPGVPVLLRSHDYHSAALNTLGLMRAGFAPSPPEVEGGRVDRDEHGLPNGMLREMAAILATSQTEDLGDDEVAEAVAETLPGLHRAGITCVHDMSGSRAHAPLRILDAGARLSIDVLATISPGDAARPALRARGSAFEVIGMKAFLDGALGSRTAHLLAPYEGEACHRGVEVLPLATARGFALEAAAAGLPSFLHAIGDAAVRAALDALQGVRGPGGGTLPHRVEHAQMIHDDDLPRFAALGIAASMQPVHLALDAPIAHRHWGGRTRECFPVRRLLDSGALVAFGSDAPIETFDVLEGIRCAVGRRGRDGTPLAPKEAVTAAEALTAYTTGAAASAGRTARLAAGAVANLTLLTHDVVSNPGSLADAAVAATVVRGEAVFEGAPK